MDPAPAQRMRRLAFSGRYWIYLVLIFAVLVGVILYVLLSPAYAKNLAHSNATITNASNTTTTMEAPYGTNSSDLSRKIEEMKSDIKQVNLNDKNISYLPINIFLSKKNLIELRLQGNPLHIPPNRPWIRHPKIRVLYIPDCGLGPLSPVSFEELPELKFVIMSGNPGCGVTKKRFEILGLDIKIVCGPTPDK